MIMVTPAISGASIIIAAGKVDMYPFERREKMYAALKSSPKINAIPRQESTPPTDISTAPMLGKSESIITVTVPFILNQIFLGFAV